MKEMLKRGDNTSQCSKGGVLKQFVPWVRGNLPRYINRENVVSPRMKYHIDILELLAVKLVIKAFTKYRDVKAILLQVDNIVS